MRQLNTRRPLGVGRPEKASPENPGAGPSAPAKSLSFCLPMPPSVNVLYQRRRGGGVALSKTAKQYEYAAKMLISDNCQHILAVFPFDKESAYEMHLTLFFKSLLNKGWNERVTRGENKGERRAKSPYKRVDVDNRVKFLQDCVIRAVGIPDDSQVFIGTQTKREGEPERVDVTLKVIDDLGDYLLERGG